MLNNINGYPVIEIRDIIGTHIVTKIENVKYPGVCFKINKSMVNIYLEEDGKLTTFSINDHLGIPIFYTFKNLIKRSTTGWAQSTVIEPKKEPTIELWSHVVKDNLWASKSVNIKNTKNSGELSNIHLVNILFSKLAKIDSRGLFFRSETYPLFLKFCKKNSL